MQEDYEEASRLKYLIKAREEVVGQLSALKQLKDLAVKNENFEEALKLKV